MNQDSNIVVRNNYIEQNNSKDRNAQGIYATECFGTFEYYNNVINMTTAKSNAIVWRKFDIGDGDVIINSNTVYGEGTVSAQNTHAIWVTDPNNPPVIKNNIIQWVGNTAIGIHVSGSSYDSTDSNIQNNVLVTRGTNIITADPLFIDPSTDDFTLHPFSPAIDVGSTLISPYNVDKNGISRPQFSGYDLGAQENKNRLPVLEAIENQIIEDGDSLEVPVRATDPDGDNLTLIVENLPVFGSFIDYGNGTGSINFSPDYSHSAVYPSIRVIATDDGISPSALSDTVSFALTAEGINGTPVLDSISNQYMSEGDSLEVPIVATDFDGDSLTLIVENLPVFGSLYDYGDGTGIITFVADAGDSGVYSDIIVITNDDGIPILSDTSSFALTINIEAIVGPDNFYASSMAENEVELSWSDNSNNEDSFIIEREIPQIEEYQVIAIVDSNVTNYSDTSIVDGQRYSYKIKAINNFTESGYSGPVHAVTVLPAPSNLTARIINSPLAIQLDWIDNADNELGFGITKKDTSGGVFAEYDTVSSNITTYTDTNVSTTSNYFYKVYAISADTVSELSDTAHVIVPVELTSFLGTVTGTSVNLLWSTVTELNNKGFDIERTPLSSPFIKGGKQLQWETIAFVEGKGTTTEENNYNYIDDYTYTAVKGVIKYRLKQIDYNGSYEYSDMVEVNVDFTPKDFVLYQNYPNPFNPSTKIKYALADRMRVKLKVYNPIGEVVTLLVDELQEEGIYEVEFNAALYKNGVYFYRIQMSNASSGSSQVFVETKKMILLK
jgi:hypothetical protein